MKKLQILIVVLLFSAIGSGQEILFETEIDVSKKGTMFPVYSFPDDNISLLINDKEIIHVLLLDDNMSMMAQISSEFDGAKFPEYIGNSSKGILRHLYFLHKSEKIVLVLTINPETKEIESEQIELLSSKERYITAFSDSSQFVLISSVKRKSQVNVYLFTSGHNYTIQNYAFEDSHFFTNDFTYTLDGLLKPGKKSKKIESSMHVSIKDAAIETKLYLRNNTILIGLDHYRIKTKLLRLNLVTGNSTMDDFYHLQTGNSGFDKSNSFVYKDVLYQFKIGNKEWAFTQVDLLSDSLLNIYNIKDTNLLSFVNAMVSFPGEEDEYISYYEVNNEKSKSTFRRISRMKPVIFVTGGSGNSIELIIGSYKYKQEGGGMVSTGGGGYAMTGGGGTYFATLCFASVWNIKTFDHMPGKINKNTEKDIYYYLYNLESETEDSDEFLVYVNHLSAKKMFLFNNEYYLGYHLKETGKFYLYHFSNSEKK